MGGRGSLSSNKHNMYDIASIKKVLSDNGIKLLGANKIPRKGLSLTSEALQTLIDLQKKHGKYIDSVAIGLKRNSIFTFNHDLNVTIRGKNVNLGRTLIIPQRTVSGGKARLEKTLKTSSRNGTLVSKTIKEAITHEYAHAMHLELKRKHPVATAQFEKEFNRILSNKGSRVQISNYAYMKALSSKIGNKNASLSSNEYVAETMVHVFRNTRPTKGRDMIDLVHGYVSNLPNANIHNYGMVTPKKIKRKRKKK